MKPLFATLVFAATLAVAAPIVSAPKPENPAPAPPPAPVSRSIEATALRVASRIIYNAHTINLNEPLLAQSIGAVSTPEPNTNWLIGVSLLGVAYLLKRKGNRRAPKMSQTPGMDILDSAPAPARRR